MTPSELEKLRRIPIDNWKPAIRFIVFGEPLGYRAGDRRFTKVSAKVRKWYGKVRDAAEGVGLSVPLFADLAYPLHVHTRAFYSGGVHCDPQNTSKGVIDALFYKAVSGDKYVGASCDAPLYSVDRPRVEVELRGWILRKYPELVTFT